MSRRDVFQTEVQSILQKQGTDVYLHDIYRRVKLEHPELCDDAEPCEHNGRTYSGAEWQHDVRWALQDLKTQGRATNGAKRGYWHAL